jgi:hypothetical protein
MVIEEFDLWQYQGYDTKWTGTSENETDIKIKELAVNVCIGIQNTVVIINVTKIFFPFMQLKNVMCK